MKTHSWRAALFLILATGMMSAQVATGTPQFGSYGGGPFDSVNLGNLNVYFSIPILHKAGRGTPFIHDLSYNSSIWNPVTSNGVTSWQPMTAQGVSWGWQGLTPAGNAYLGYSMTSSSGSCGMYGQYTWQQWNYSNFFYYDQFGTTHPLTVNSGAYILINGGTQFETGCPAPGPEPSTVPWTGYATDGSGYTVSVTPGGGGGGYASASLVALNGTTITPLMISNPQWGSQVTEDPNGNEITTSTNGVWTDTLGQQALNITAGSSSTNLTYTAPGGQASYVVGYTSYTVKTNFGVSGVTGEYGPLAVSLVGYVALPDDTTSKPDRYTFKYEKTPGSCTPLSGTYSGYCVTARIATVTLPTGGIITYTYSGGSNGIFSDGSTAGLTRMLSPTTSCSSPQPSGCWEYSRTLITGTPGPGSTWQTSIFDPNGDNTVINFAEDGYTAYPSYNFYETQRQVNQYASGSQTPMLTTVACYNNNSSNCATVSVSSPIYEKDVTLQYPNGGQQTETKTSYGGALVTGVSRYAYGASGPGGLLQTTSISYSALGHPSQVSVSDGSGHLMSQTSYYYDESAYPIQKTNGTPQHVASYLGNSPGNLTTITYYSTGSSTLSKHFQYYDTGTLYKSWDVNGSSTSYTSYTYDQTAQGNSTKSCGNSFATMITLPPTPNAPSGLSIKRTWDCNGGLLTSTTDPNGNGNSISTSYSDPYFWRPVSTQDQLLNTTKFRYTAPSGSTPASTESYMIFNNNSSIAEQLTTLDSFGRVQYSQQQEGVGSGNYDSIQMAYDALGRLYQSTMPYVAGAGQGSSTAAVTTTTYDALGRVRKVQDGGTGYVSYSYNQNDVLQVSGPAPSGENLKQKQLEYDALGRLISVCEITTGTTKAPSGGCGQQTALPSPGSGYLTTYTYGVNSSNLPTFTVTQNAQAAPASKQTRTYVYDLLGRLIQETNPETGNQAPGTTYYYFDLDSSGDCAGTYNGDLVKKVDNRGNKTCYTYDALHRVQTVTYTSSSPDYPYTAAKTFVYDAATYGSTAMSNAMGRMAEAYTGSSGSKITDEFFSYSKRGELVDVYESTPHAGTPYYHASAGFWANGAVGSLALVSPANVLPSQTFGVDGKGRASSVTASSGQNSNVVGSTVYDVVNYKTTVNFGSGDSDVFTMDPNTGRLKQYTFNVGSNSDVGKLTWNANGTLGSLQIIDTVPGTSDSQTCNYTHDDMMRVATVNCGNSIWRQNFAYDAFGNITKDSSGYTGLTFSPSYSNTTNQFTSIGSVTPTYDTDGRLTYDGTNHYTWDAESKLLTVDTSPTTTVTYDALGRAVEKQVGTTYTEIVFSPLGSKLAVMSGQTLIRGLVPLPSGTQAVYTSSGLAYYRHTDHLGSSRLATTPNRTLYSSIAYAPFGEPYKEAGTTDRSFTGQDQDTASGMHDFLDRKYIPNHGRWLTPDPAGLAAVDPANPQSWNRYAYVRNNPLALVDPFGDQCYDLDGNGIDCGDAPDGSIIDPTGTVVPVVADQTDVPTITSDVTGVISEPETVIVIVETIDTFDPTDPMLQLPLSTNRTAPAMGVSPPCTSCFDTQAFAQELNANANDKSTGYCGRYISWGLDAGGSPVGSHNGGAYGPLLVQAGWNIVSPTGYSPQQGDIIIYAANTVHTWGHAVGYDGQQWVSDYFQHTNPNPYRVQSSAGAATIYRNGCICSQ